MGSAWALLSYGAWCLLPFAPAMILRKTDRKNAGFWLECGAMGTIYCGIFAGLLRA
ncbi:hypothetical protein [Treponema endosymbiont of Eucomonympha sp.]|uniref:hypothetical protein n=1 Tax=Treponema endosymbiont of Eucomonympha sp. TaxID=1580831 RepID=UPI000A647F4B|nr:hypothetical protein [Treponema endosymbiont of Eucomonympha sp.]